MLFVRNPILASSSRRLEISVLPPAIARWELKRLCPKEPPSYWDMDASPAHHNEAVRICGECPVKQRCLEDFHEKRAEVGMWSLSGVYGGLIWDGTRKEGYSVEEWHRTHKAGGEPKRRSDAVKYPPGWTEERTCPCGEKFWVTSKNALKVYHTYQCANKAREKREAERSAVA